MEHDITRRRLLQVTGIAVVGAAAGLVGCGQSRNSAASSSVSSMSSGASTSGNAAPTSQSTAAKDRSLVLVFSRAGENYGVGTVQVGNTMVLAQMIAEKTGSDLFEIERTTPYPEGYDACCDEALEEQRTGARPALKEMPNITGYKTVYFGFPCWWGDLPMPVYTAIEALDWNGKTISPFCTHAGSGESGMFSKLAAKCTGATVTSGLTMSGVSAQNDRVAAGSNVDSWLASLN